MNFFVYLLLVVFSVLTVFSQRSTSDRVSDTINNIFLEGLESIKNEFDRGNKWEDETIAIIKKSSKQNRDENIYPEATNTLEREYILGTERLAKTENIIFGGLKAAEIIQSISSEASKELLQQTFEASSIQLIDSAIPILKSFGKAVALSNDATGQGLENASKLIQEVIFAVQKTLTSTESLIVQGTNSGDKSNQLLFQAVRLAFESSFASAYSNIQQSIQIANSALRNVQSETRMTSTRLVDSGENCTRAEKDPETSEALKTINESANNALKNGANADLVNEFEQVLKCSLGAYVVIIDEGEKNVREVRQIAYSDPQEALLSFNRQAEIGKRGIFDLCASIYSVLGRITYKSDNQSNQSIPDFIRGLEAAKSKILSAIRAAGYFEVLGMRYQGDAFKLAVKAAEQSGYFGKSAFIQGLVDVAKPVFALL